MVDYSEQHWYVDLIRSLFGGIDTIVYNLLRFIYEIFFNVANANMLSGDTIRNFYGRVQLIIGIIFMFKMAISLFNGILNPESAKDNKSGMGAVVKKIIVVLIMMALLVPLDIPGADMDDVDGKNSQKTWNTRLNENGILFGTLFELQSRLLSQNTVSRLILGTAGTSSAANESYEDAAKELSNILLKCFLTINLQEENGDIDDEDDYVCPTDSSDEVESAYDLYLNTSNVDPGELLSIVNVSCDFENNILPWNWFSKDVDYYAFSYSYIFSTVVGVFCVIVFISFTVDAAIRVFKLAILRLISPIPVLSYLSPKGSKTFENWVKTVTTTYLDLFIRLAIINFVVFFIREFDQNGLGISTTHGAIGVFSKVFIYLGLLLFAREAPKFITDTLGIQGGGGLFGGLAALTGGISSTISGVRAARSADPKNQRNPEGPIAAIRHAGAGLVNGISGAGDAYQSYGSAKEHNWRSSLDKVNRANAVRLANAAEGGTWWGTTANQFKQDFTGDSDYDKFTRRKKALEEENKKSTDRIDKLGKLKTMGEEQAVKKHAVFDDGSGRKNVKIDEFIAAVESAKSQNLDTVRYNGGHGSMSLEDAIRQLQEFKEAAGREYIQHSDIYNGGTKDRGIENLAVESQYNIDATMTDQQFATDFKMAKINEINAVHARTYGDNGKYKDDNIKKYEEQLPMAEANRRGSDAKPGGK